MNKTTSIGPDARTGHQDDASVNKANASEASEPVGARERPRVAWLVLAGTVCLIALLMLAGGGWALWMDRFERDANGFLSIGTTKLNTGTYSLVSELRGDGPRWLYGSTVLGNARVRATPQTGQALFIGIAPTNQISSYLEGTGYATIEHLESGAVTTHAGGTPSVLPTKASIWAASTEGTGEQTLLWRPRAGDWSIVLMNTNASAGVTIRGDVAAKVPLLPWIGGALLAIGIVFAVLGVWFLILGLRRASRPTEIGGGQLPGSMSKHVQAGS